MPYARRRPFQADSDPIADKRPAENARVASFRTLPQPLLDPGCRPEQDECFFCGASILFSKASRTIRALLSAWLGVTFLSSPQNQWI